MSAPKPERKSAYQEAMFAPKGSSIGSNRKGDDHGHRP
jgi:hypothetical protein